MADLQSVVGGLLGGKGGNALVTDAMSMLGGSSGSASGLGGLAAQLTKGGLGKEVESWIGTGKNKPVTGAQVSKALGKEKVAKVAKRAGVTHAQAASGLAALLPELVNHVTPDGKMPSTAQLGKLLGEAKTLIGK